ncbi:MAG: YicC/YloC family endoribonuclease [Acutalibacteraceae bacterium]|jgi:uncharacterized protein (TIGR00255 family)
MLKSMTGFGRASEKIDNLDITVEIKSVNHRYFEFSARMSRAYQYIEEDLRALCQQSITRGKVEITVSIEDNTENGTAVEINRRYADGYISALRQLAREYKIKNDLKLSALINNPELLKVKRQTTDEEAVKSAVLAVAAKALEGFVQMRITEGEKLKADVLSRVETILKAVEFIEQRAPETVRQYRERLEQKMKELLGTAAVDEQRLITETALFADRIAVDEETVRLRSHISQMCNLLESGGVIGKKLDFLIQEMNREANTIGSKSQNVEISHTVVNIKSEIEKIREQIQNIE